MVDPLHIQVRDVSFSYGERRILNGITTSTSAGEFVFLLGANGTGKSTLMRLMVGELEPDEGRIEIENGSAGARPSQRSRNIAYLPQDLQDPPFISVREVVSLGRFNPERSLGWRLSGSDASLVDEAIDQCDMAQLTDRQFSQLSGGEKQRAWLAFCLAQQRQFIFLDESLQSLDHHSRNSFFEMLSTLAGQGKGVMIISHDLEMARRVAQRVLVLRGGNLAYDGPPTDDLAQLLD